MAREFRFNRVLLKISGEALKGTQEHGYDAEAVRGVVARVKRIIDQDVEVALVVGAGNVWRGVMGRAGGMDRVNADYMGMLATVLNAVAVQDALEKLGCPTRVLSAITMQEVCEPYILRRAERHLEKGRIIICSAGTGNPYFTTDTAAVLRGMELRCQAIIKATKVDGIYDKDPVTNPDAVLYKELSYSEALQKKLRVMDATAFSLAMENNLPIMVCSLAPGNITNVVQGMNVGTIVHGG